jgi:hypothetical protein
MRGAPVDVLMQGRLREAEGGAQGPTSMGTIEEEDEDDEGTEHATGEWSVAVGPVPIVLTVLEVRNQLCVATLREQRRRKASLEWPELVRGHELGYYTLQPKVGD